MVLLEERAPSNKGVDLHATLEESLERDDTFEDEFHWLRRSRPSEEKDALSAEAMPWEVIALRQDLRMLA